MDHTDAQSLMQHLVLRLAYGCWSTSQLSSPALPRERSVSGGAECTPRKPPLPLPPPPPMPPLPARCTSWLADLANGPSDKGGMAAAGGLRSGPVPPAAARAVSRAAAAAAAKGPRCSVVAAGARRLALAAALLRAPLAKGEDRSLSALLPAGVVRLGAPAVAVTAPRIAG
jgi:hypothetical protein